VSRLRVALVEVESARTSVVSELLNVAECELVACYGSIEELLGHVGKVPTELVVVSATGLTPALLDDLVALQSAAPTPVALFAADDAPTSIQRAVQAGVSAYVVDGVNPLRMRSILEAALARFRQFKALADELQRTRSQLTERKVVERAKGIVMAQRGLTEEQAYKLMRKTAMDRNKRMADIADSIIAASDLLGAPAAVNQPVPLGVA